jgi:hypothetical protein
VLGVPVQIALLHKAERLRDGDERMWDGELHATLGVTMVRGQEGALMGQEFFLELAVV